MSPAQLSRLSGLKQPTISAYLNQGSIPSIESCSKIASALGVPVSEVLQRAYGMSAPEAESLSEVQPRYAQSTGPDLDDAERIVLALRGDQAKLKLWLEMGQALADVAGQ